MQRFSLRLRIFLFFLALAIGSLAVLAGGLWLGQSRFDADPQGFVTAGLAAGFGILGLGTVIWLLFDENVAKPITGIAAELRSRAHAGVSGELDGRSARYLGDLAPAAVAVSEKLGTETIRTAERIAAETARLTAERAQLTAALSEIPVAVLMLSRDHRIILYDGQAVAALEPYRPLCLGRSIFDYLQPDAILHAVETLDSASRHSTELTVATKDGTAVFEAHLRSMGESVGYMLTLQTEPDASVERPLVFDFDLFNQTESPELGSTALRDLTYVVFDTETTGLDPDKDDVVQIGAVRIVKGRWVEGEVFDTLVNPGRPLPVASTRVHGISDAMVAGAPSMAEAGRRFRQFAEGAVLVAHNAPFDMAFLRRDADAVGASLDSPVLDTVLLSATLYGAEATHTLDAIADRLEVDIPDSLRHTALGDAEATAAVFLKMLPMLEARGIVTFGAALTESRAHSRILPDLNSG